MASDPFSVLGLSAAAGAREVAVARRRLAKLAHPDSGGSVEEMQRVNDAADAALAAIAVRTTGTTPSRSAGRSAGRRERSTTAGPVRRDHPSFTIEALPVEAFEALLIVSAELGELIDDDPPYVIELALSEPSSGWCRLELVPDAGASTVSVAVAGEPAGRPPPVDDVRDAFVRGLNQLDWAQLGG